MLTHYATTDVVPLFKLADARLFSAEVLALSSTASKDTPDA